MSSASASAAAYELIKANVPLSLFIGNAFVAPVLGGKFAVVDPAEETVITADVPAATGEDVDLAVAAATAASKTWGKTTGAYVGPGSLAWLPWHSLSACACCVSVPPAGSGPSSSVQLPGKFAVPRRSSLRECGWQGLWGACRSLVS